ncbi:MAG TPA: hypothetical protein VE631_01570 [Alphaproteobacteria bacterium]|jgi:hypothetical protein|nr:hypothetical protein [Alphaproteobacteria bacterium]
MSLPAWATPRNLKGLSALLLVAAGLLFALTHGVAAAVLGLILVLLAALSLAGARIIERDAGE